MLAALGDVERTESLARETLAEGREQGEPKFVHFSLHYLADCALWRGDAAKAVQLYGESLRAALDYGNEMEAATELQGMAMGLMGSGNEEEGFRFYGASMARFEELQTTMIDEVAFWVKFRERYLPPAREGIGAAMAEKFSKRKVAKWVGKKHSLVPLRSPEPKRRNDSDDAREMTIQTITASERRENDDETKNRNT